MRCRTESLLTVRFFLEPPPLSDISCKRQRVTRLLEYPLVVQYIFLAIRSTPWPTCRSPGARTTCENEPDSLSPETGEHPLSEVIIGRRGAAN